MIQINERSYSIMQRVMSQYDPELKKECQEVFEQNFEKTEYRTDYGGETVVSGKVTRKFAGIDALQEVDLVCEGQEGDRVFQLRGMNSTGKTTAALAIAMYLGFDFEKYEDFIKPDNRERMKKMLSDTSLDLKIERGGKTLRVKRGRKKDLNLEPSIEFEFCSDSSERVTTEVCVEGKSYEEIRESIVEAISEYIDVDFVDSERELRRNVMTILRTMLYDDLVDVTEFMTSESEIVKEESDKILILVETMKEYFDQVESEKRLLKGKKQLESKAEEIDKTSEAKRETEERLRELERLSSRFVAWESEFLHEPDIENLTSIWSRFVASWEGFTRGMPEMKEIQNLVDFLVETYCESENLEDFDSEEERIWSEILHRVIRTIPEPLIRTSFGDLLNRMLAWEEKKAEIEQDEELSQIESVVIIDLAASLLRQCDFQTSFPDYDREPEYESKHWQSFLEENNQAFKDLDLRLPDSPDDCHEDNEIMRLDLERELSDSDDTVKTHEEKVKNTRERIKETEDELVELSKKIEESLSGILDEKMTVPSDSKGMKKLLREVETMHQKKQLEWKALQKIKNDAMNIQSMFEKDNIMKFHTYGFKDFGREEIEDFIEHIPEDDDPMFRGYIARLSKGKSLMPILDALNSLFKEYLGKHFHFDIESEKVYAASIEEVNLFEEHIGFSYTVNGRTRRVRHDFDGLGTGQKTVMSILTTAAQRSTTEIGRLIIVDEIGDLVSTEEGFLDRLAQVLVDDARFSHIAAMIFIIPSDDGKAVFVPRKKWWGNENRSS